MKAASQSKLLPNIGDLDKYLDDTSKGFKIYGSASEDHLGGSISSAGDLNGDGVSDLVLGTPYSSPNGKSQSGSVYVIYGSKNGLPNIPSVTRYLSDSQKGAKIYGSSPEDALGFSVSRSGDLNDDGFGDLIVSAIARKSFVIFNAISGMAYIMYGSPNGNSSTNSVVSTIFSLEEMHDISLEA
jgi:hypothetical protein